MTKKLRRRVPRKGIQTIARAAGVSTATVSRALNQATAHLVAAPTLERVRAAANKVAYRPNLIARSLMGVDMRVVGVLSSEFTSGHAFALLNALQETLRTRDYWPMLAGTLSWRASRKVAFDALISRGVEGLIILPALLGDPIVAEILQLQIPASGTPGIPSVRVDDDVGMRELVAHLVKLGHRSIACLTGPLTVHSAQSRTTSFQDACRPFENDGVHGEIAEVSDFKAEAASDGVERLLSMRRGITAIVATSDTLALGCMDALRIRGIAVPEMVSVAGYGDIPMMDRLKCALTTVRVPVQSIGRSAGRCILELLDGRKQGDVVLVPSLVIRESTAAAPSRPEPSIRHTRARAHARKLK